MWKASILVVVILFNIFQVQAKDSPVHIAVASNFAQTLEKLSESFKKKTGHKIIITKGSTGTLYAQIVRGAPFDIFLSADSKSPQKLDEDRLAIKGSRFTYATGVLALWHPSNKNKVAINTLMSHDIAHIAIANPKFAPYGIAAKEVLISMNLWKEMKQKLVYGNNISHTFQMVENTKKTIGFVALSQLLKLKMPEDQYWIVPDNYHNPIIQQAVLLNNTPAATNFMTFLKSDIAKEIILNDGYK